MINRINIGTASIILILIVLCLSVFSLLGLSDGKSAEIFAQRYARSVTAYYQVDAAGQRLIRDVWEGVADGKTAEEAAAASMASLPRDAALKTEKGSIIICEIPMNAGQVLHMELDVKQNSVRAYYVYNKEDYAIDNRLPVWSGTDS